MEEEKILRTICEQVENQIKEVGKQEVQQGNVEYLYKLIDIHKDIKNEIYWEEMLNNMYRGDYGNEYGEYGNEYGNYNDGGSYGRRSRDSRGRYTDGGYGNNYGRRGYDTKYRGDEMMNKMHENYGRYMENKEVYGNSESTKRSLRYMLDSLEDFARMLKEDAQSEEEVQMIRETAQKIAQM